MIKNRGQSSIKTTNSFVLQMLEEAKKYKLATLKLNLNSQKVGQSQITKQSGDLIKAQESKIIQLQKIEPLSNKSELIEAFLESIKLDIYVQKFKENGFEALDILFDIEIEQLYQMEIPLGHQSSIMKRIKELKQYVELNEVMIYIESKYDELEGEPTIDLSFTQPILRSNLFKEISKMLRIQHLNKFKTKRNIQALKNNFPNHSS